MFPASAVLRALSRLVPAERRKAWLDEWRAEVAHAWAAERRGGGGASPALRVRLTIRAVAALRDALWIRRRAGGGTGGASGAFREALRFLRRRPGFALAVIATLALGTGSATAIFSVVDGLMLRPIPFHEPEQLVSLFGAGGRSLDEDAARRWSGRSEVFQDVRLHRGKAVVLTGAGEARSLRAEVVEPGFLELIGVRPLLGRTISSQDAIPGTHQVVLLGDEIWREAFGADPGVVGRTVLLNDEPHTVVGVLPPTLRRAPGGIVHLVLPFADAGEGNRSYALGRLRPGLTVQAAEARLAQTSRVLQEEQPRTDGWEISLRPLSRSLDEPTTRGFRALMGAVLLLLVIGCANAAGLLLLRGIGRRPELALRLALGGSRASLVRLVLAESLVLSAAAGVVGTALAWAGVRALVGLLESSALIRFSYTPVGVDGRVLAFAFGSTLVTAALFGALPALRAGATPATGAGRGSTPGRRDVRLRAAMQVGQLALAVVLLWGAGVLGRSFLSLSSVPVGYRPERLLHLELVPLEPLHGDRTATLERARALDRRLLALPGVDGVARMYGTNFRIGDTVRAGDRVLVPELLPFLNVDTAFFRVAGIEVLQGRAFRSGDEEADVVVVDRDLADALWPAGGAVGRTLAIGSDAPLTVLGVTGDMKIEGPRDPLGPYLLFHPSSAEALRSAQVWIRTTGKPAALAPAVRSLVRDLDPGQPIRRLETGAEALGATVVYARFLLAVVAAFSAVALLLSSVGVYGLVSFTVAQRTRELGVRKALGAQGHVLVGSVLRRGLLLGLAGVGLGLAASTALSRVLVSLVYGVGPLDPVALLAAAGVLLASCAAAAAVPARRAAAVDASEALRSE